jgi:uncharacterized protein (DUF952 family)
VQGRIGDRAGEPTSPTPASARPHAAIGPVAVADRGAPNPASTGAAVGDDSPVSEPLLHLVTIEQWRAAVAAGVLAPPSLAQVGFVHLSTPEQVHLPAQRMFPGRRDIWLLVLDPDRLGVEVRYEPGLPTDPTSMLFPHAYGPGPLAAVTGRAALPTRPRRPVRARRCCPPDPGRAG